MVSAPNVSCGASVEACQASAVPERVAVIECRMSNIDIVSRKSRSSDERPHLQPASDELKALVD